MFRGLQRFVSRAVPRSRFLSTFDDRFTSFPQAAQASGGYDDHLIDDRSVDAARSVLEGHAAFERDGVVFTEPDPRRPVVEALTEAHTDKVDAGPLKVLDVGGGLGSAYWQNIRALQASTIHWTVLERPSLCDRARELPQHPIVYRSDMYKALDEQWDVILFSSVLQYLPEPHRVLSAASLVSSMIIVDRTPMHAGEADLICVQTTPAHIYRASYPAWIFGDNSLEADLGGWNFTSRFSGIEPSMTTTSGVPFTWCGFTAVRGNPA